MKLKYINNIHIVIGSAGKGNLNKNFHFIKIIS